MFDMKKIILCGLLVVLGAVFSVSAQQAAFQQAVQQSQAYSQSAHQKVDTAGGDYSTMENQRTFEAYQKKVADQQSVVDLKQRYLDSLIQQKAPRANIERARKSTSDALEGYDAIMRDFAAWVASITQG
jgi:hypothetical protein